MVTRWKATTAAGVQVHLPEGLLQLHVAAGGVIAVGGADGTDPLIVAVPAGASPIIVPIWCGAGLYRITGPGSTWAMPSAATGGGAQATDQLVTLHGT